MNEEYNRVAIAQEVECLIANLNGHIEQYGEIAHELDCQALFDAHPLEGESVYSQYVKEKELAPEERLLLAITIVALIRSDVWQNLFFQDNPYHLERNEMNQVQPSMGTLLVLLAGTNIQKRLEWLEFFNREHFLFRSGVIFLKNSQENEGLSSVLQLNPMYLDWFVRGEFAPGALGYQFAADELCTDLEWNDLILNEETRVKLEEVKAYLAFGEQLRSDFGLQKHMKPGYRCLFYGPSGTGKTIAACLLGKLTAQKVMRVDLSRIVSKYVGETTRNLSRLFDIAQDKNWILFFDEGDALLGKRSTSRNEGGNSHYAHQEVAFLLQRMEQYNGLLIVATNLRDNMDVAFTRRFENIIHFGIPDEGNRLKIWEENLPSQIVLGPEICMEELAQKYKLSGASILNVIQRTSLKMLQGGLEQLGLALLENCIRDEMFK